MSKAKSEYLKIDEGTVVRPGETAEDALAFKEQMLKTLKQEWGFEYDPELNWDLDHPDLAYGGKGKYWVLETNGKVVGTMSAQDEGERVHWRRLSIDPEYRKKGWGWQMQLLVARYSQAAGFKTAYFDTLKDSGTYKMYERIGCEIVAEHQESLYVKIDMELDLGKATI
jgi:GNAT superfamily N-acetyltransferase